MLQVDPRDREKLIDPLYKAGFGFWLLVALLLAVISWGMYMYIRQVQLGLGLTGMQRPVYWGVYMVNFIFFIGISHAGTLISAILRVTGAEWRRPITRIAEAITAFALIVGTLQIIIDMGRPDRLLFTLIYGRLQSPILWDIISVTVYFLASVTYLYLPLIPDVAILRDNLPENAPNWRRILYQTLAIGWRGNIEQWRRLEKAISIMAIAIIPVAISVHTIISWILATTVQPGWHSTIFGPYFVVGAIFSGIGALFLAMTAMRHIYKLEEYIQMRQYRNLGLLFLTMNFVWVYFTYSEHLILAVGQQEMEFPMLSNKLWGSGAGAFWSMIGLMIIAMWMTIVPALIPTRNGKSAKIRLDNPIFVWSSLALALVASVLLFSPSLNPISAMMSTPDTLTIAWLVVGVLWLIAGLGVAAWFKSRPVGAVVVAAFAVVIGMWLERWNIIVPTMTHPRLIQYSTYTPTLTEVSLTAASVALFIFMFIVFFKLFPAVSLWEVAEGRIIEAAQEQIVIPAPSPNVNLALGDEG